MHDKQAVSFRSFAGEVRSILAHGRQVWHLVPWRHKVALLGAALLMAVVSTCNVAFPLLLGRMVDEVKSGTEGGVPPHQMYTAAAWFLGLIAAAYVVREGLQVLRRWLVENSCTRIEKTMTTRVVSQLLKVDLSTLTQEKIGALQGRISRSVVGFVRFLRLGFLDFFPPLMTGVFAIAAALTKQPMLALFMAGIIPVSLVLTMRQLLSQKGIRLRLIRSREQMDGAVVELLGGMDYVRAANTQEFEIRRVSRAAEARRALENNHHFRMSLFGCAKALNEGFFHILVLAAAIWMAINGSISFGDVLTFSILFMSVMAPLNEVHRGLDEGHECSLMVKDLLDMLHVPPDRSFSPPEVRTPQVEPGQPLIAVKDLVVEYATPSGTRRGLDGVSAAIHHGETIGLAGPSGCGKTTWLRVLMRLTHPTAGEATIGGVPLEFVSREALGQLVGYVGQSPFVFHGTVAENIAYGKPEATREMIETAARKAHIHTEIMEMPGGFDALVTERGLNLSGGQRQRLALARIFLKDPPIMILDEGTSALDTISEREVQKAIDLARKDRTVILVAHRLSTLRDADRILVFQGGRIAESGTYLELYRQGGVFTELVNCAEVATVSSPAPPLAAAG
jgi:ATP-binding cassette subfamily B protein